MVGNGREWSGAVGSELETVFSIPRALRILSGMVGGGREWPGAVGTGRERSRKRTRRAGAVGRMVSPLLTDS